MALQCQIPFKTLFSGRLIELFHASVIRSTFQAERLLSRSQKGWSQSVQEIEKQTIPMWLKKLIE
jgi:hypothetical protein